MGGTLSKWHCRVERIVNITVCLQRREPAFLRFLMFGSKEMEKIKASQDKGALSHFLNVCAHAPSPQLFICQSSWARANCLHAGILSCVCVCVHAHRHLKSHIWFQIKWCMKERNDRERKWELFNVAYLPSNPNIRPRTRGIGECVLGGGNGATWNAYVEKPRTWRRLCIAEEGGKVARQTRSKRVNWMERRQKAKVRKETAGAHFMVWVARVLRYSRRF